MWWRMGDDNMAEWHEEKGDQIFDFTKIYKEEVAKASKELHKIIDSSNPMMYRKQCV